MSRAIDSFYDQYGETPSPDSPSPLSIKDVWLFSRQNTKKISKSDLSYFDIIHRSKTTYDADIGLLNRIIEEEIDKIGYN